MGGPTLIAEGLRRRLTDPGHPGSLADRTRTRRRERLLERFPRLTQMRVLDLGGRLDYWRHARLMPGELTLINLEREEVPDGVRSLRGDACDPPPPRPTPVLSNSVIDQVGDASRRAAMAEFVRSAAPHYWIQTANRYFPVDPYFLFPGLFALPGGVRAALVRRWPLSYARKLDPAAARELVDRIDLMSARDLTRLFPDGELTRERLGGFTKSLVVVR